MRLEVGTFPVNEARFGPKTQWHEGLLEVNKQELLDLALKDGHIPSASIDIVAPGESVRIVNMQGLFEPKVKVSRPGMVYPGICGRPVTAVGQGRTHRLGNVAVMLCTDNQPLGPSTRTGQKRAELKGGSQENRGGFLDMSGPGNLAPFDALNLICLTLQTPEGEEEDSYLAIQSAVLRIADRLVGITVGLPPPELETFDLGATDPSLPGFVFIAHLASREWHVGPRSHCGTSVYGQTRLSAPWLLYPTEVMDGAVFMSSGRTTSWQLSNNLAVIDLARRHGKSCNFLGCIIQRTNWTTQAEKDMAAERAALLAKRLGAKGAIVTTDFRGQRFLETALTVRACERQGIKTVLLTGEEDNEEGAAPPLLVSFPEIETVVSTGTGGFEQSFPPVEEVVGAGNPDAHWFEEKAPVHGRYGLSYITDYYGFGYESAEDY
jgi:hypothetical protein